MLEAAASAEQWDTLFACKANRSQSTVHAFVRGRRGNPHPVRLGHLPRRIRAGQFFCPNPASFHRSAKSRGAVANGVIGRPMRAITRIEITDDDYGVGHV